MKYSSMVQNSNKAKWRRTSKPLLTFKGHPKNTILIARDGKNNSETTIRLEQVTLDMSFCSCILKIKVRVQNNESTVSPQAKDHFKILGNFPGSIDFI